MLPLTVKVLVNIWVKYKKCSAQGREFMLTFQRQQWVALLLANYVNNVPYSVTGGKDAAISQFNDSENCSVMMHTDTAPCTFAPLVLNLMNDLHHVPVNEAS